MTVMKAPRGQAVPAKTISADAAIVLQLTEVAHSLNVTVHRLATAAIAQYLKTIESDPLVVKKLALKAKWDTLFSQLASVEKQMVEVEVPKQKKRKYTRRNHEARA